MRLKKTYFLAPTRDQPPTGAIALGNLIQSPRTPEFPLNDPNSPTITRLLSTATTTAEADATRSLSSKLSLQPTIFATFLSGLLGTQNPLELTLEFSQEDAATYRIPRLETRTINPSLADVRALFAEPSVQAALRDSRFSANLYLVTGVQVAHGAEYVVARARGRGAEVRVVADGVAGAAAAGGVPVGSAGRVVGPFVFAYCLREVLYKRKAVTGQRRARVEGDLYGDGEKKREVGKKEEGVEFEGELAALKEEDPELPEHWDLDVEEGLDLDGEECQIVRTDVDQDGHDDDDDEDE
ncbi:hypothetical protein NEMBOFW57_008169 [Staphylotrichum longicolle]|uniref:Uncharacterized protein n=1 Tax=Staphylotrichum longicolle TaxID=669026 RepID=A0AAD4ERG0_9PEZI|nr:hypothetical protein NEMBOFW57_008169 [Staphylotrichum longicolle]